MTSVQLMIMNDELPDGGFSIESLGDDAAEQARHQLSLLEKSLGSSRDPAEAEALLDEAYRAAHSLKSAIDPRRMPNVDRLARRVQDVVRATRSGTLAVTPALGSMLASVARIARGALDAVSGGGAEPLSASSAAAALEEVLAHPGAWTVPPALSGAPVQWARVEATRLHAAGEAAGDARAAATAFARAAHESGDMADRMRAALEKHEREMQGLLDALPAGLGRAARGEPTTSVAAELVEMVSALGITASQLGQSLSRTNSAVREAAAQGTRAAEKAETAFGSLRSVRLDALLDDLPRTVRRLARNAGRAVELVLQPTNLEVHAERAEKVNSLVKICLRAMIGLSRTRGRTARSGAAARSARISVRGSSEGESLCLRLAFDGATPDKEHLKAALEAAQRRLSRDDGTLEVESRKGENASILLTVRLAAAAASRSEEFVLARAGEAWYAILAASVVECIEAGMSMPDYMLDGARLPTLRMNDTLNPRVGVVVKTPRGSAVLLFDVVGGREIALQTTGGSGAELVAGISGSVRRPDGRLALLVDLAVLLPAR
jgi:chemotaxis protein histidine kinase CheA